MADGIHPGAKGERLPAGVVVFRLAVAPKDYDENPEALAVAFELSRPDKQSELKSLSVYVDGLTTPRQALDFMEGDKAKYDLALYLNVDEIRRLRPVPDSADIPDLDVVWDPRFLEHDGVVIPDPRPGAEGHAGITGLNRPAAIPRSAYKYLRARLAEMADARQL